MSVTRLIHDEWVSEVCGLDHHYLCDEYPASLFDPDGQFECKCWCHPFEVAREGGLRQLLTGQEP